MPGKIQAYVLRQKSSLLCKKLAFANVKRWALFSCPAKRAGKGFDVEPHGTVFSEQKAFYKAMKP